MDMTYIMTVIIRSIKNKVTRGFKLKRIIGKDKIYAPRYTRRTFVRS